jgi:hypothetical protein
MTQNLIGGYFLFSRNQQPSDLVSAQSILVSDIENKQTGNYLQWHAIVDFNQSHPGKLEALPANNIRHEPDSLPPIWQNPRFTLGNHNIHPSWPIRQ